MNQGSQTDQFDELWGKVLDDLDVNNKIVLDTCLPSVRKFVDDKVLLNCPAFCRTSNFHADEYSFVIGMPDKKEILFISYALKATPHVSIYEGAGFDSTGIAFWLYDEFHLTDNVFEHHVIFSDGVSYVIPFDNFYHRTTNWFTGN